jgi:hypothetical protein
MWKLVEEFLRPVGSSFWPAVNHFYKSPAFLPDWQASKHGKWNRPSLALLQPATSFRHLNSSLPRILATFPGYGGLQP